jgi:hypothetical protein
VASKIYIICWIVTSLLGGVAIAIDSEDLFNLVLRFKGYMIPFILLPFGCASSVILIIYYHRKKYHKGYKHLWAKEGWFGDYLFKKFQYSLLEKTEFQDPVLNGLIIINRVLARLFYITSFLLVADILVFLIITQAMSRILA